MAKRSLKQIEESLRNKLAEAGQYDYDPHFGDIGKSSPHRGDPIVSPDLGGGVGPGGAGRGSLKPDLKGPAVARARDRAEAERIRAQQNKPFEPPATATPKPTTPPPAAKEKPKAEPPADKPSLRDRLNQERYGTTDRKEIEAIKQQRIDRDLDRKLKQAEIKKVERETPSSAATKIGVGTGLAALAGGGYYASQNPEEVGAAIGTMTGDAPTSVEIPPEATADKTNTNNSSTSKVGSRDVPLQGGNPASADDESNDFRYVPDETETVRKTLGVTNENQEKQSARDIFLQRVIGPESGGKASIKNPKSSATGLYQFLKDTWADVVAKARPGDPHYGVSFKDMPKNVEAQHAAARQIAREYEQTIKNAGMPDIPTSYYLLHGHGPTGVKIYQNPNAPLKNIYPEYVRDRQGNLVRNKIYTQNPNLDPNKPAMQVVSRMARDMGDRLTDVFPSARAGELPKDQKTQAAKPIEPPQTSFSAAEIAKLPPVERFGHILPGVNRNKQGGLNLQDPISKKPYALPDGRVITDPTILRDIYKIQQQELANTQAAMPKQPKDDSFLSKAGRVLGGELASDVFAPKDKLPKDEPKTVPPEAALDPGERIVSPDELKPPKPEKPVATKAEKGLSDFERAFAAARKEQGAKGEFSYTDPKTGKTGTFTTAYRDEKPTAIAQADKEVFESINTTLTTELQDILRLAGRK